MPVFELVFSIILTAVFAVLFLLCRVYFRRLDALEKQTPISGTVQKRVFEKNFGNSYDRVTVSYTVDGREYRHSFNIRPNKFRDDDTVEIVCLPQKPQIGYAICELGRFPKHAVKAIFAAMAVMYIVIMLLILGSHRNAVIREIVGCSYVPVSALTVFFEWRHYRRHLHQGVRVRGTVVYTQEYNHNLNLWVAYSADGRHCESFQRIPPKHRKRDYAVGEPVEICYSQKEPMNAILAEEPYASKKERMLRLASILAAVASVIYIAVYIAISLIFP